MRVYTSGDTKKVSKLINKILREARAFNLEQDRQPYNRHFPKKHIPLGELALTLAFMDGGELKTVWAKMTLTTPL